MLQNSIIIFLIVVRIWGLLNIRHTLYKIHILVRKKVVYTNVLSYKYYLYLVCAKAFLLNERSMHTHEGICQKWVETSVVLENNVLKIACWCWMFATLSIHKFECSKQLTMLLLSQFVKLFGFEYFNLGLIKFNVHSCS